MLQKAVPVVGIDDAHGLQIGVDSYSAHKLHAASLQIPCHLVREGRSGLPGLVDHGSLGEVPQVGRKAAPLPPDVAKHPGVVHGCPYFAAVADDVPVLHEGGYLFLSKGADSVQVEAVKGLSEGLSLVEDAFPGKAGLKGFQHQHLEEYGIVVHRLAPFLVVVANVGRILGVCPFAARFSVRPLHVAFSYSAVPLRGTKNLVVSHPSRVSSLTLMPMPPA